MFVLGSGWGWWSAAAVGSPRSASASSVIIFQKLASSSVSARYLALTTRDSIAARPAPQSGG
eukprot:COSAG04_NODE_6754_length_1263_cov_0.741409_4_plen_61_part_01